MQFHELKLDGTTCGVDPNKLAERLEVNQKTMAALLGVHRNALINSPNSPKVQRAIRGILRVMSLIERKMGKPEFTEFYFVNLPVVAFGHKTIRQTILDGNIRKVIDYLLEFPDRNPIN